MKLKFSKFLFLIVCPKNGHPVPNIYMYNYEYITNNKSFYVHFFIHLLDLIDLVTLPQK